VNINTSVHLMVKADDVGDVELRIDNRETYGMVIDRVYLTLRHDDDAYIVISGTADNVVAYLMAAAGKVLEVQGVTS
jgi:hypothetical protein